jgi:hypothetical protein
MSSLFTPMFSLSLYTKKYSSTCSHLHGPIFQQVARVRSLLQGIARAAEANKQSTSSDSRKGVDDKGRCAPVIFSATPTYESNLNLEQDSSRAAGGSRSATSASNTETQVREPCEEFDDIPDILGLNGLCFTDEAHAEFQTEMAHDSASRSNTVKHSHSYVATLSHAIHKPAHEHEDSAGKLGGVGSFTLDLFGPDAHKWDDEEETRRHLDAIMPSELSSSRHHLAGKSQTMRRAPLGDAEEHVGTSSGRVHNSSSTLDMARRNADNSSARSVSVGSTPAKEHKAFVKEWLREQDDEDAQPERVPISSVPRTELARSLPEVTTDDISAIECKGTPHEMSMNNSSDHDEECNTVSKRERLRQMLSKLEASYQGVMGTDTRKNLDVVMAAVSDKLDQLRDDEAEDSMLNHRASTAHHMAAAEHSGVTEPMERREHAREKLKQLHAAAASSSDDDDVRSRAHGSPFRNGYKASLSQRLRQASSPYRTSPAKAHADVQCRVESSTNKHSSTTPIKSSLSNANIAAGIARSASKDAASDVSASASMKPPPIRSKGSVASSPSAKSKKSSSPSLSKSSISTSPLRAHRKQSEREEIEKECGDGSQKATGQDGNWTQIEAERTWGKCGAKAGGDASIVLARIGADSWTASPERSFVQQASDDVLILTAHLVGGDAGQKQARNKGRAAAWARHSESSSSEDDEAWKERWGGRVAKNTRQSPKRAHNSGMHMRADVLAVPRRTSPFPAHSKDSHPTQARPAYSDVDGARRQSKNVQTQEVAEAVPDQQDEREVRGQMQRQTGEKERSHQYAKRRNTNFEQFERPEVQRREQAHYEQEPRHRQDLRFPRHESEHDHEDPTYRHGGHRERDALHFQGPQYDQEHYLEHQGHQDDQHEHPKMRRHSRHERPREIRGVEESGDEELLHHEQETNAYQNLRHDSASERRVDHRDGHRETQQHQDGEGPQIELQHHRQGDTWHGTQGLQRRGGYENDEYEAGRHVEAEKAPRGSHGYQDWQHGRPSGRREEFQEQEEQVEHQQHYYGSSEGARRHCDVGELRQEPRSDQEARRGRHQLRDEHRHREAHGHDEHAVETELEPRRSAGMRHNKAVEQGHNVGYNEERQGYQQARRGLASQEYDDFRERREYLPNQDAPDRRGSLLRDESRDELQEHQQAHRDVWHRTESQGSNDFYEEKEYQRRQDEDQANHARHHDYQGQNEYQRKRHNGAGRRKSDRTDDFKQEEEPVYYHEDVGEQEEELQQYRGSRRHRNPQGAKSGRTRESDRHKDKQDDRDSEPQKHEGLNDSDEAQHDPGTLHERTDREGSEELYVQPSVEYELTTTQARKVSGRQQQWRHESSDEHMRQQSDPSHELQEMNMRGEDIGQQKQHQHHKSAGRGHSRHTVVTHEEGLEGFDPDSRHRQPAQSGGQHPITQTDRYSFPSEMVQDEDDQEQRAGGQAPEKDAGRHRSRDEGVQSHRGYRYDDTNRLDESARQPRQGMVVQKRDHRGPEHDNVGIGHDGNNVHGAQREHEEASGPAEHLEHSAQYFHERVRPGSPQSGTQTPMEKHGEWERGSGGSYQRHHHHQQHVWQGARSTVQAEDTLRCEELTEQTNIRGLQNAREGPSTALSQKHTHSSKLAAAAAAAVNGEDACVLCQVKCMHCGRATSEHTATDMQQHHVDEGSGAVRTTAMGTRKQVDTDTVGINTDEQDLDEDRQKAAECVKHVVTMYVHRGDMLREGAFKTKAWWMWMQATWRAKYARSRARAMCMRTRRVHICSCLDEWADAVARTRVLLHSGHNLYRRIRLRIIRTYLGMWKRGSLPSLLGRRKRALMRTNIGVRWCFGVWRDWSCERRRVSAAGQMHVLMRLQRLLSRTFLQWRRWARIASSQLRIAQAHCLQKRLAGIVRLWRGRTRQVSGRKLRRHVMAKIMWARKERWLERVCFRAWKWAVSASSGQADVLDILSNSAGDRSSHDSPGRSRSAGRDSGSPLVRTPPKTSPRVPRVSVVRVANAVSSLAASSQQAAASPRVSSPAAAASRDDQPQPGGHNG